MDISEFKRISEGQPFRRHPWELARGRVIIDLLHRSGKFPSDHIADIGSGDAYIASVLLQHGAVKAYSAIDNAMAPSMAASLEKTIPQARFFTDLNQASDKIPAADVILILDVLEHVPDENTLLADIRSDIPMTDSTKWIITVPAFQSLFSHHDVLLGHYRRYTLTSLTHVCKANRLIVEKKGYFFLSLLLLRILVRAVQKVSRQKRDSTIQGWKGSRFLTALLTTLLEIDYKIGVIISKLGINIPGLSCYCICHQSPS
jgi:hypothetical protein